MYVADTGNVLPGLGSTIRTADAPQRQLVRTTERSGDGSAYCCGRHASRYRPATYGACFPARRLTPYAAELIGMIRLPENCARPLCRHQAQPRRWLRASLFYSVYVDTQGAHITQPRRSRWQTRPLRWWRDRVRQSDDAWSTDTEVEERRKLGELATSMAPDG